MSLSEEIKKEALELGFDLVGITDASPIEARQVELLRGWLEAGYAGRMSYMQRNFEKRICPANLLEGARSVICLGLNYKPPVTHKRTDVTTPIGRIAGYAQYENYHTFISRHAHKLVEFVKSLVTGDIGFRVCVDSPPVAERALAQRAHLGFIGRNHTLINPEFGPQIFLGEIIIDVELQADEAGNGNCASCNKCVQACPTGALRTDGQFDARRCISYLTIEHKGEMPADLAVRIGDRLFGCDECILACPYQERAPAWSNNNFRFYEDRAELSLTEVLNLDEESFDAKFADSVIKRPGLETLKRNARICLANTA
ncbi:MAG TPA: tRNA epoxyqueuosine(34) reductase QueG [Sedimentisphaerales bacterium]|nr:tRNA epoxyqueuosine(34) reductase QueG [Sedimentisphaerales bacterium]